MLYGCCCIFIGFFPVHVYANSGSTGQFETALNSFEVEGLSLGMKQSETDIILNSAGYKLKGKVQKKRYIFYKYLQRKDKKKYWVEIYTPPKNDKIETLKIILPDLNGQQTLENEKQRILKAFGKYEKACESSNTFIRCHNFTDTNKLLIEAQFVNKHIKYTLQNKPSAEAGLLAGQPANGQTHELNAEKDEDAEWEAAIAEEKAKRANIQVQQAERELYQEDIDLAVKENEQAKQRALEKDAAERTPKHDDRSVKWYLDHKGVDEFKKTLDSYEVDGLLFGTEIPALEKALVSQGYQRYSRKLVKGNPVYVYKRKAGKNVSVVEMKSTGFDGIPNSIVINVFNADGKTRIAEEKVRMLNAFSGSCKYGSYYITCYKYTKTNALSISVDFRPKPNIKYTISNLPSSRAR